jgi:phosphoribosyl 1,2-cyclic phosphodiesterase
VHYFCSGETLRFGDVSVYTVRTPHDAADGVVFIVECEGSRLGIFTDVGHPFPGFQQLVESVDGAYLECNYDPGMLESGGYSPELKARIRGKGGHLSNEDSAWLMRRCSRKPKWLAMAHLSEENNHPELAFAAQRAAVGKDYPVLLASRYTASPMMSV